MALATYLTLLLSGLGLAAAGAAQANPPGVHYAWQRLAIDTAQCLDLARQALGSEGLDPVQNDATSVAGRSPAVTALFVCAEDPANATTVTLVVASSDDTAALALREALQRAF